MSSRCPVPLQPTYVGYLGSTFDALVLLEACLRGQLTHVPRRPQDRERSELIHSGNIFIYEEGASGIKRWTDGVNWSPSRILGNFLIYRELAKPFPPGEKKRALKKGKKAPVNGVSKRSQSPPSVRASAALGPGPDGGMNKDLERALVGSLVDSYTFKEKGLIKKTISIANRNVLHHIVSYYDCDDVIQGRLRQPTESPEFAECIPRPELMARQNFRSPLEPGPFLNIGASAPPAPVATYQPPPEAPMPVQEVPDNMAHYRPASMAGMPPPGMPFAEHPDFNWAAMPYMDGFAAPPQPPQQLPGAQYSHGHQPGIMFDQPMPPSVNGHPGAPAMMYPNSL